MILTVQHCSANINEKPVLTDVSFAVHPGEIVSVVGPSGAGKTTLLRCIAGLHKHSGAILFDDNIMNDIPVHKRQIGFVHQHLNLFPHLTVSENIAYPLRLRKIPTAMIKKKIHDLLIKFDILKLADRLPQNISGGEQQRVAFARALIYEPALLLLDEPFGSLDTILRYELIQWLQDILHAHKTPTVFVTHDIREAQRLSSSVIIISSGQVITQGSWEKVMSSPQKNVQRLLTQVK